MKNTNKTKVSGASIGSISDSDGRAIDGKFAPLIEAAFTLYPLLLAKCSSAEVGVALKRALDHLQFDHDHDDDDDMEVK